MAPIPVSTARRASAGASPDRLIFDGAVAAPPGLVVDAVEDGHIIRWSVANASDQPIAVDRVRLRFRTDASPPMFTNGYQSWSYAGPSAGPDPSLAGAPGLMRAMHHADPSPALPGERRSELVTQVADTVIGFDGGARHDGTFRLLGNELIAEAYLGGAVLVPGERRDLHAIGRFDTLDSWARWASESSDARVDAPYQVGWCSWYHYFERITEATLRENLDRAADWPFEVFQLDDGFQAAIGDWLETTDAFPSGLARLAADVAARGLRPGLWIAPFLAAPGSAVAHDNPEWFVRRPSGRPAVGMINDHWGGAVWALDTTRPDVLAHLEHVAEQLVAMGWTYLKLDFTYAPSLDGDWHDASLTPAQRVRQAYDAIRRGAGDDAFLLGCGAPLGACIGVVDGMRIGPDVAPTWEPAAAFPGYADTAPSTANALRNTVARQFMHRRLWLNDPDCLMLRTTHTELTDGQVRRWAGAVSESGGMALVSDDLALLGAGARALLDEVVTVGRQVDEEYR